MRKVLPLLIGTAVLWVPAVSIAGDSSSSPSTLTSKSEAPDAKGNVSNPASTCQNQHSEPNRGTKGGKGRGAGANGFGRCVSTIAKDKDESHAEQSAKRHGEDGSESGGKDEDRSEGDGKESASPAMACKAMQANDLAHFQARYGRRPNAFGKCVANHAKSKRS